MNHTNIETVLNPDGTLGYSWNPITGCTFHTADGKCKGGGFPCYAYQLAHGRLKTKYQANTNIAPVSAEGGEPYHKADKAIAQIDPFYPREWFSRRERPLESTKPKGVFVCDMSDLFGFGVPDSWINCVLETIRVCPEHRFYLLTKQPQRMKYFSPFPPNCWVGVTVTRQAFLHPALAALGSIEATMRYLYFEPLLEHINVTGEQLRRGRVGWVIIGGQTRPTKLPDLVDVETIMRAVCHTDANIWLKDSLRPLYPNISQLVKEIPHG